MKDSISSRIWFIIKHLNMNMNSFSKAIGLTNNVTIGRIISEEREPGFQVLYKILQTFGSINANWLITGEGEAFAKSENGKTKISNNITAFVSTSKKTNVTYVPLYNIEAIKSLTALFNANDEHIIDYIRVPGLPRCDGAIHVKGDSMYPLLKSGDIVFYKQVADIVNDIFWGDMYLLSVESGEEEFIAVRYLQKSEIEQHIKLLSYNNQHEPKDVHYSKIRALALVKASIRINSIG